MEPTLRDDHGRLRRWWREGARMALMLVSLLVAGCTSSMHTPYVPGPAPALVRPIAAQGSAFDYPGYGDPSAIIDHFEGVDGDYWVSALQLDPAAVGPRERAPLSARYYQGKGSGAKPLVIVLPVWGVSSYPSNTIAAGLRAHSEGDVNVLLVDGEQLLFDWDAMGAAADEAAFQAELARMVAHFVATVTDVRRVVDWAQGRPEVDPARIALVGFSMSAIVGSVAMANEPRIGYGVLVVGGADLHEVLAICNGRIRRTREALLERFDWTLEDLKARLKGPLEAVNPVRFGGRVDPARLLVIDAAEDSCVPEASRERFWEAMGRPERISYQYGHRATFLALTFLGGHDMQHKVYAFLDRTLAPRWARYQAAQFLPGPP
jgi:dienelactone hydrolase